MRRIVILLLLCASLSAQETVTPDLLWNALLQGNKQFVAGKISYDTLKDERAQLRENQNPPITILSCSDSRVPPELVLNQSLGALFVVRSAGNVVDDLGLASIEFAVAQGYTKLIVVLSHESCGAVKASLGAGDPSTPAMTELARRIRASFAGVAYDPRDVANVKRAVEANTRASAAQLLANSRLLREAALANRIKIMTAYYDMGTGEVKKLE